MHYDVKWLTEQFENGNLLDYVFFWGHTNGLSGDVGKFCLSQWFESPFDVGDVTYKTSEHWMMAHKAYLFGDQNIFDKIVGCQSPLEAKELGRKIKGYDERIWSRRRFEIVKSGNIHKFNQHPRLADFLLKTENKILVEASPADTIWGIGLPESSEYADNVYAWRGLNLLGFALMETRDFLKSFGHFEPLDSPMPPPWARFPHIDSRDMFWRMGKGENYLMEFNAYYDKLSDNAQVVYKLTNLPAYGWEDYYH